MASRRRPSRNCSPIREIDIVVNLTIPEAHFPVSKTILEAGKHVYSEKPLVLSLEQGEELRGIAEAKNLKVGCAPDTFLGGAHQLRANTSTRARSAA